MQFLILIALSLQLAGGDKPPLPSRSEIAPILFAMDEQDRVAITHNRDFRPKFIECQELLGDYYDQLIVGAMTVGSDAFQQAKTLKQLQLFGKLKRCAKDLKNAGGKLQDKLDDFQDAVGDID